MKRLVVLLPMVILVACSALKRTVLTVRQLQELQTAYKNKHYFDLRDALQQTGRNLAVCMNRWTGTNQKVVDSYLDCGNKYLK